MSGRTDYRVPEGTSWSDQNAAYLEWGDGEKEVYICQNSTVHLKPVHVIVYKSSLNKADKKAKINENRRWNYRALQ